MHYMGMATRMQGIDNRIHDHWRGFNRPRFTTALHPQWNMSAGRVARMIHRVKWQIRTPGIAAQKQSIRLINEVNI